jgi:hypothetical protein
MSFDWNIENRQNGLKIKALYKLVDVLLSVLLLAIYAMIAMGQECAEMLFLSAQKA